MSDSCEQKLAVLIDADNASKGDLKAILEEIAKYGTPTVKRAYGDWSSPQLAGWKEVLLENGAVPVQQYAYTTGKNATDAAMIIDAKDFLHGQRLDGFVLISSDSDFTPLALRIRESGLKVYGIGEKKTPKPFIKACDKFIYVDILRPEGPSEGPVANVAAETGPVKPVPSPVPTRKRPSDRTVEFIAKCIAETSNDDGVSSLAVLGSMISKSRSDFDSRNYGYAKLSEFLKSIGRFEVTLDKHNHPQIRDRRAK